MCYSMHSSYVFSTTLVSSPCLLDSNVTTIFICKNNQQSLEPNVSQETKLPGAENLSCPPLLTSLNLVLQVHHIFQTQAYLDFICLWVSFCLQILRSLLKKDVFPFHLFPLFSVQYKSFISKHSVSICWMSHEVKLLFLSLILFISQCTLT